tara:strand:- start:271 stop:723 length:453 start_codon:yes stop_codon:yes gene_type:complete
MGNTISSIKSGFSRYFEFVDNCLKYQFKCESYPLVEKIVDVGIILPCQIIVLSPILASRLPIHALYHYPVISLSHCFVIFKLGVPFLSKKYILTMGCLQLGYYILKEMYEMDEHDRQAIHNQMVDDIRRRQLRWEPAGVVTPNVGGYVLR